MKIWFISDTHFFHKNIIRYENRPFWKTHLDEFSSEYIDEPDVESMNEKIIKNWNSNISKNDKVFHLGDVSFANQEKTKQIIQQLNGYKILIMGNHDKQKPVNWWKEAGFDEVYKWPIIYSQWYILSHEPVYLNQNMPYINIHGHLHNTIQNNFNKDNKQQYINVCVEKINYTPITFEEIVKGVN